MADVTPTPKDYKIARNLCPGIDFTPSLHAGPESPDMALGGGCPQCVKTAKAIAEVRRAGADADPRASKLRQAIGLMTTAKPDLEVDLDDPVAMAQVIVDQATAQKRAMFLLAMRLRTVDPNWKLYRPGTADVDEGYRTLFDAVTAAGAPA